MHAGYLGQVYEKADRKGRYALSQIMQYTRAVVVVYGSRHDRKCAQPTAITICYRCE